MAARSAAAAGEEWLTSERGGMLAAEVCTVLAVLRRNARFAERRAGGEEHPLVAGLKGFEDACSP